jgi:hypothetical protein
MDIKRPLTFQQGSRNRWNRAMRLWGAMGLGRGRLGNIGSGSRDGRGGGLTGAGSGFVASGGATFCTQEGPLVP